MSSNINASKVNPMKITIVPVERNLSDPIQARLRENELTLKKSKLWVRRNKVSPISVATQLSK